MNGPHKENRGPAEAERARHLANVEAVGLSTTAAMMLLGLAAGAEAQDRSGHSDSPPSPIPPHELPAAAPQTPAAAASFDVAASPALIPPKGIAEEHGHHAAVHHAVPAAGAPIPIEPLVSPPAGIHATTHGSAHGVEPLTHPLMQQHVPMPPVEHATASPANSPVIPANGAPDAPHIEAQPPYLLDSGIAGTLQIGATVNATLQQVTATATNDIAHVVASVSDDVAHVAAHLSTMAGTLSSSVASGVTAEAQHLVGTAESLAQHVMSNPTPHLDAAGAVPVPFVQLPPLQLGFLGQPTADGQDTHDGSFSALGAHHF